MLIVKGRNESLNFAESPGILLSVSSMSEMTGAIIFPKTFFDHGGLQIRSFHHYILFMEANVPHFF